VDVLDALTGQAAVDDGHEHAAVLDARDRLGERVGLERQDDQRVDLVDGDQVLEVVGLLGGSTGGVDDDLEVRVGGLEAGLGLGGPPVHAAGPAVGGGGDGDADDVSVRGRSRARGRATSRMRVRRGMVPPNAT
jgi:hypothetical protein